MDGAHFNLWTWFGNILSAGTVAATMVGLFPAIAAVVALVWYCIQIAESETVRRWAATRRAKRIAKLKAKVLMLEAKDRVAPAGPETGVGPL